MAVVLQFNLVERSIFKMTDEQRREMMDRHFEDINLLEKALKTMPKEVRDDVMSKDKGETDEARAAERHRKEKLILSAQAEINQGPDQWKEKEDDAVNPFPKWVREKIKELAKEYKAVAKWDRSNMIYKISAMDDDDADDLYNDFKVWFLKQLEEDAEKKKWSDGYHLSCNPLEMSDEAYSTDEDYQQ